MKEMGVPGLPKEHYVRKMFNIQCLCTQVKYIGRFLRGGRGMLASLKKKKKITTKKR